MLYIIGSLAGTYMSGYRITYPLPGKRREISPAPLKRNAGLKRDWRDASLRAVGYRRKESTQRQGERPRYNGSPVAEINPQMIVE